MSGSGFRGSATVPAYDWEANRGIPVDASFATASHDLEAPGGSGSCCSRLHSMTSMPSAWVGGGGGYCRDLDRGVTFNQPFARSCYFRWMAGGLFSGPSHGHDQPGYILTQTSAG